MGRDRRQSVCAYLATILLIVETALLAGHLHPPHHRADASGSTIHTHSHRPDDRTTPDAPGDDHRSCPICWVQHAGGGQLLPLPPLLSVPDWLTAPRVLDGAVMRADQQAFPPFQPRAPPHLAA